MPDVVRSWATKRAALTAEARSERKTLIATASPDATSRARYTVARLPRPTSPSITQRLAMAVSKTASCGSDTSHLPLATVDLRGPVAGRQGRAADYVRFSPFAQ